MAYSFVPFSMTLDYLEGHSLVQDLSNEIRVRTVSADTARRAVPRR